MTTKKKIHKKTGAREYELDTIKKVLSLSETVRKYLIEEAGFNPSLELAKGDYIRVEYSMNLDSWDGDSYCTGIEVSYSRTETQAEVEERLAREKLEKEEKEFKAIVEFFKKADKEAQRQYFAKIQQSLNDKA